MVLGVGNTRQLADPQILESRVRPRYSRSAVRTGDAGGWPRSSSNQFRTSTSPGGPVEESHCGITNLCSSVPTPQIGRPGRVVATGGGDVLLAGPSVWKSSNVGYRPPRLVRCVCPPIAVRRQGGSPLQGAAVIGLARSFPSGATEGRVRTKIGRCWSFVDFLPSRPLVGLSEHG